MYAITQTYRRLYDREYTPDELDRMIILDVKRRNELGDVSQKQLIIEIMGRHSNIILVDHERNLILDSIKHVSYAVNSYRAILPGQEYKLPPAQDKLNPFTTSNEEILNNWISMQEN